MEEAPYIDPFLLAVYLGLRATEKALEFMPGLVARSSVRGGAFPKDVVLALISEMAWSTKDVWSTALTEQDTRDWLGAGRVGADILWGWHQVCGGGAAYSDSQLKAQSLLGRVEEGLFDLQGAVRLGQVTVRCVADRPAGQLGLVYGELGSALNKLAPVVAGGGSGR